MSIQSLNLFKDFLKRVNLPEVWFMQCYVPKELTMTIPEKKLGVRIAGQVIPTNESVYNSKKLLLEIHKAQIEADKELKSLFKRYQLSSVDMELAEMFCGELEMQVLPKLLWPFEYLSVEGDLNLQEFSPLAMEMMDILDEFYGALDAFLYAIEVVNNQLESSIQAHKAELDRQSLYRKETAPVKVYARGTIRDSFFGPQLDVYARVIPTITEGMLQADYMVNNLIANRGKERKAKEMQKEIFKIFENSLTTIIKGYVRRYITCIKDKTPDLKAIYKPYLYSDHPVARPHTPENANEIFKTLDDENDFAKMKYYFDYYKIDFDAYTGKRVYNGFINGYYKDKKFDTEYIDLDFYLYYYKAKDFASCAPFFAHFKKSVEKNIKQRCDLLLKEHFKDLQEKSETQLIGDILKMIKDFPNISRRQEIALSDMCRYHLYKAKGDEQFKLYSSTGDEKYAFVFDWEPEDSKK